MRASGSGRVDVLDMFWSRLGWAGCVDLSVNLFQPPWAEGASVSQVWRETQAAARVPIHTGRWMEEGEKKRSERRDRRSLVQTNEWTHAAGEPRRPAYHAVPSQRCCPQLPGPAASPQSRQMHCAIPRLAQHVHTLNARVLIHDAQATGRLARVRRWSTGRR